MSDKRISRSLAYTCHAVYNEFRVCFFQLSSVIFRTTSPKNKLMGLLPWNIPGNRELSHPGRISSVNGGVHGAHYDEHSIYDGTANCRYSAASVAIECLKNVPIMMRKYIRQIMSIEDNESTAQS